MTLLYLTHKPMQTPRNPLRITTRSIRTPSRRPLVSLSPYMTPPPPPNDTISIVPISKNRKRDRKPTTANKYIASATPQPRIQIQIPDSMIIIIIDGIRCARLPSDGATSHTRTRVHHNRAITSLAQPRLSY
ncbi:hypothetical protein P692DRAFT_20248116 [Suillus brevipes Sb2]|nr:hypothetical protein P692DRAFT_20248116 [Suillus brevipes Sb2]